MAYYGFQDSFEVQQQDSYQLPFQPYDHENASPYHSREDFGDYHDDVDALLAEIANSSPSPPDRSGRTRAAMQMSLPFPGHVHPQTYPSSFAEVEHRETDPPYDHEMYEPGPSSFNPDMYAPPTTNRMLPHRTSKARV
ncbi:hypothetical protein C8Q78DRAFT_1021940 [Trametes maxima]|nr:hypothetical protein C8Q78DRAFT_1021940 [Trametes maxima]